MIGVFNILTMLLLLASPVVAQTNLLVENLLNPTFDDDGGRYGSDYTRIYGSNGVGEGCYTISNTTANHGVGVTWAQPANSSGRFMQVNGYGGTNNPLNRVWYTRFPIPITPNTTYVFSCKVANLNPGINGQVTLARLQLKMDDLEAGDVFQLLADNNWHEWTVTWYNESATEVIISIYDVFTGLSSYGDDFAMDDLSFVAIENTAPSFTAQTPQIPPICAGDDLDLTTPAYSANGATIMNQGWVASPTAEGNYTAFNLNNIPSSYNGWYIRYKVESSYGSIYSDPAQQLTVNVAPSNVGAIQTPAAICVGDDLNVVAPTFEGTGTGSWEICQNSTGTYQPFNIQGVTSNYNGWYLRYKVSNECGDAYSNPVQITVVVAPDFTALTPQIQPICAGGSLSLTPPAFSDVGSTIINQGWVASPTELGNYSAFNLNNIPASYNGWYICYMIENGCGAAYSVPARQLIVNAAPEITGALQAPAAICAGSGFTLTTPTIQNNGSTITNQGWQIQVNGSWQTLNNSNIPYEYNGCLIRYFAENECGVAYSTMVQVEVYSTAPVDEGDITACDAIYHHGQLCDHNGDYSFDSITPNNCTIEVSWHFTLGEAYIAPVQSLEACDSYYWPKTHQTYYVSDVYEAFVDSDDPQVCDSTYTLDLTINHAPVISSDLQVPANVCVGTGLTVVEPQYQMNHSGGGSKSWEYATSPNGPFTAFDPMTSNLGIGTCYLRFVVSNTCDEVNSNVVSFHVDGAPVANVELSSIQVCEGQTLDLPEVNVTWNNVDENDREALWQMSTSQNGTFTTISPTTPMQMSYNGNWLRFVAHNSCGDDIIGPVMITVIAEAEDWLETVHACDSYTLQTGEVVTQDQVVDYEYYEPCYHVVHQPIEISYSDEVTERITSCHESYYWHGMTFQHSSNTQYATVTLNNAAGCDSVVNLQLDFGAYSTYTHDRIGCDEFVWEMNPNHTYTTSTIDSVFVAATNDDDCDTWYYLNLTMGHDVVVEGGDMTECSGFVWHGVPYYADAIVYDSLQTPVTHCDSIVAYQLHIVDPVATETDIVACNPIWWQEHFCEEEGDYQHTFQSVYGCDSVVTMHFSFSEQLYHEFDSLSCEPFSWYEYQCNTDGMTCTHVFQTAGCDSTVVMHVVLSESVVTTQDIQACDSYEFNGVVYDTPGIIFINQDTLQAHSGCDSIVQIRLEIRDSEAIGWIHGTPDVYVASNLISGVYRYDIDLDGVTGGVVWSLADPQWQIMEAADDHCIIVVTTPGTNTLIAHFMAENCGEMERSFEINAGYFGVEDLGMQAVQVYPNPTKGTVRIEAESIESLRLIDKLGQVLEVVDCHRSDSYDLNLSTYAPSVYLLEIKTVNGIVKKPVVLCR